MGNPFGYAENDYAGPEGLTAFRERARVTPEVPTPQAEEAYYKQVKQLEDSLNGVRPLVAFLQKHNPRGTYLRRIPFGLLSDGAVVRGPPAMIQFSSYRTMRPAFMVLSDETAASFNISYFTIGNMSQDAGSTPIPCDTFAVNYYARCLEQHGPEGLKAFIDVQRWTHDTCTPANRITMYVENVTDTPKHFRGILWGDCQDIL